MLVQVLVVVACALCVIAQPLAQVTTAMLAHKPHYSRIVVFGDSLVDNVCEPV